MTRPPTRGTSPNDAPGSTTPENVYYVMLGFGPRTPVAFRELAERVVARTGGRVDDLPHLTIAYLRGSAPPEEVVRALDDVAGPPVEFRARGLFAFSDEPHGLLGHLALLRVERTAELHAWHRAVVDAVSSLPLQLARGWEGSQPHLRLALRLPRPLTDLRPLPADLESAELTLAPTHLHVTKLEGESFAECLRRPLRFRRD